MTRAQWLAMGLLAFAAMAGCHLDNWEYYFVRDCPVAAVHDPNLEAGTHYAVRTEEKEDETVIQGSGFDDVRPLIFHITADFPAGDIVPEEILVDGTAAKTGDIFEVGKHRLSIRKWGYEKMEGELDIPLGFGDYTVIRQLVAKARPVVFDIKEKGTGKKIQPDQVLVGAVETRDGGQARPGRTSLEIRKRGYNTIVDVDLTIPIGESPYTLSYEMEAGRVELRFEFTDAKTGKQIEADTIELEGKSTRSGSFVDPGNYRLTVHKIGYNSLLGETVAVPQTALHVVQKALDPAEIAFSWAIFSDYPKDFELDALDLVRLDGRPIREGDNVSPGKHEIEVQQAGYELHKVEFNIPPRIRQYEYKGTLKSLPRLIELAVSHDIEPPAGLPVWRVTMNHLESGKRIEVRGGMKIKTGTYDVAVEQPAYETASFQKRIFPASFPEKIECKLDAKPRPVDLNVTFIPPAPTELETQVVFVEKGTGINRAVRPGRTIRPGVYQCKVDRPGYEMVGGPKDAVIQPSEDRYVVSAQMKALPRILAFNMTDEKGVVQEPEQITVDGQPYVYKAYEPGSYRIRASFRNFETVEQEIVIPPGVGSFSVSLRLTPKVPR